MQPMRDAVSAEAKDCSLLLLQVRERRTEQEIQGSKGSIPSRRREDRVFGLQA